MIQTPYPKVVILTNRAINDLDSHGALLRNYFKGWPKECLGHIFQEKLDDSPMFCGSEYALSSGDRRFGGIYSKLKSSPLGAAAHRQSVRAEKPGRIKAIFRRIMYLFGRQLLRSGLAELVFVPRISPPLVQWMESFAPQIIYVQGYSLFYIWLALKLQRRFSTKICLHVLDDWPGTLYSMFPFAPVIRPVVRRSFKALADSSALRICIGTDMRDEYRSRYGLEFVPLLNCDEMSRYVDALPRRTAPEGTISIVYSGSIGGGRWKSLIDVCEVAKELRASGLDILVTAYVYDLPPDAHAELRKLNTVLTVAGSLRDSDVPGTLKGADILLLIESFEKSFRKAVKLSISTKAHLYMMAQRSILVYGPPDVGVVRYALRDGWAHVATSLSELQTAMRELVIGARQEDHLVATAFEVALRNHNAVSVRRHFAQLMREIC